MGWKYISLVKEKQKIRTALKQNKAIIRYYKNGGL